jgi:protoporphyrinogen oxidase
MDEKSVAVIGGGLMGITLAYLLAQSGFAVTVYERGESPGGLASSFHHDGVRVDRFYHTILSSDMSMQQLIVETGIRDRLHFTETKQGFYDGGKLYPFNTPIDFLRFPPLSIFQRIRLGLQIIAAQFEKNADKMDQLPVEDWLLRVSGPGVYNKVWKPLLRAKFDSEVVDVPATYIWSRLRRMMATRRGVTSREMMCYLEGGYYTLIEALIERCEALGVTIKLNTPVDQIATEANRVVGVCIGDDIHRHDAAISTLPSPTLGMLLPDALDGFRGYLMQQQYLGVLCPLLILNAPLTPYYVLNITDDTIPFTAVVETTNLIDPKHVDGCHLVYLPKYITGQNAMMNWTDEAVQTEWMRHFKRMFPDFDESTICAFVVQRDRLVEPLRPIGTTDQIPDIVTPVQNLFMSNTVMVYPDLNNGESVTSLARRVVEVVKRSLPITG